MATGRAMTTTATYAMTATMPTTNAVHMASTLSIKAGRRLAMAETVSALATLVMTTHVIGDRTDLFPDMATDGSGHEDSEDHGLQGSSGPAVIGGGSAQHSVEPGHSG